MIFSGSQPVLIKLWNLWQAATDMFVMLLDVHKWVAMPAVAARARQAGSTADPSIPKSTSYCTSIYYIFVI